MVKMWQKIKCWLGLHDWWYDCTRRSCTEHKFHCESCEKGKMVCKHCGKIKK